MDWLLKVISYSKCEWKICGDLKVIGLLLGMQSGYTKFSAVCVVDGAAEQKTNITRLRIGPCEKTQFQRKSMSGISL
jgi:hypothetical protein